MVKTIFDHDGSTCERSLVVNDDGTLTYFETASGWAMTRRKAPKDVQQVLTADAAKARWPEHAARIDEALRGNQEG